MSITPELSATKAGSAVWVDVTMENKTDHDISVYRENTVDQGGFVYKTYVWDEKGAIVPETKFGKRIQDHDTPEERVREPYVIVKSGGDANLKPGQKITDRVEVTKLYFLLHPGKYTIQLQRFDMESKSFLKSNKVTVTVTP